MTQEQIEKAFEGRWRVKADNKPSAYIKGVKDLCRDFFTAGILIAERSVCCHSMTTATIQESTDSDFDTWWKLYDLKCGKEKCLQKWNKLTKKEQAECIRVAPAYVASTPDKQFRKRPLTYLNQKAWNDEIIPYYNGTEKPTIDQQRMSKLADILTG